MLSFFLSLDIGGTWIKGVIVPCSDVLSAQDIALSLTIDKSFKVRSNLGENYVVTDFINNLNSLLEKLKVNNYKLKAIGISTAGIVKYNGSGLSFCAPHLQILKSNKWIEFLKNKFHVPVVLINDAEAVTIGAAALGYCGGDNCYGIAPIGTGLGFMVLRNGRRWTMNNALQLPLLGSICTPQGSFDDIASVSILAKYSNSLENIFTEPKYAQLRREYVENLARIFYSAGIIYGVNIIYIAGGLANAVASSHWNLEKELSIQLENHIGPLLKNLKIKVLKEGNKLQLIGSVLLARGIYYSTITDKKLKYADIITEKPYDSSLMLHTMNTTDILQKLIKLEEKSGNKLKKVLPILAEVIDKIYNRLKDGGRLVYVGCGTSGRLAAIDTVELSCTFGFPRDKVLTFIAGGVTDAAIDIERNFEEDANSVPELLMANITSKDVIIGISVSGKAKYVRSALLYGKVQKALTIMIQASESSVNVVADNLLPLYSGLELIAGSTRMKAGTATKKLLNFISTTVMIKLGKVHGSFMTNLECLNDKLIERAINILKTLFQISRSEALKELANHNYNLTLTIKSYSENPLAELNK